jgi:hypothetical protein
MEYTLERTRWYIEDNWPQIIVGAIAALLVVFLLVFFFQPFVEYPVPGRVVGLEYSPDTTSVGVGNGVSASGQSVTVVTTSGESEKWVVIMQQNDGIHSHEVTPQLFYSLEVGQDIVLACVRGKYIPISQCGE